MSSAPKAPKAVTAPKFIKTIQDVTVKSGQLARLDAKITATKPYDVYWGKNGSNFVTDITHKVLEEEDGQHTLMILEAAQADQAVYECIAVNQAGEARCQAKMTVLPESPKPSSAPRPQLLPTSAPQVIEPLKDVTVKEEEPATFKTKISNASGE